MTRNIRKQTAVIPAKAGIHMKPKKHLDTSFRWYDEKYS